MTAPRRRLSRLQLRIDARHRRVAMIVIGSIVVASAVLWFNRWRISRTAIHIADPLVRAWAAQQVLEGSDSVYHLVASTIRVDDAHRRIMVDTVTITTDAAVNNKLPRPHPAITLRFRRCGLTGINLSDLTGGAGLHALRAGCDSMSLAMQTLVAPVDTGSAAASPDSSNFLRFQGKVDLPSMLPHIAVDLLEFPHIHVSLDLLASDGRRTAVSVDSVALRLDSIYIDPSEPVAKRRPLFSRDITVRIDRFEGTTKADDHVSLQHLTANLEDGTASLDDILFEPQAGHRADSLGFALLRLRHVRFAGVRWRSFLLASNIAIGQVDVDTTLLRMTHATTARNAPHPVHQPPVTTLESSLRGMGRVVILDSVTLKSATLVEASMPRGDSNVTTIKRVALAHLAFSPDDAAWTSPFPLGHPTLAIDGVLRRTARMNIVVAHVRLDATGQRITIDSLRAAPEGNDSAFQLRNPYRKARLSVVMNHVEMRAIDLPAFVRRGELRARALDVRGLVIDILKDKNKPEDPAPNIIRRTPQGVLHDAGVLMQIDTVLGQGLVTYRERDPGAVQPGILSFGAIQLHGYNFSTDPKRMTATTPFRLVGDARLMGAGAMHVEWKVPLLSHDFAMQWSGTLGPMDPKAMNGFLPDAVGMRFTGGTFEGAQWSAMVHNGLAQGQMEPRWHDLHVELPGVARSDSGMMGGLVRGVAKLAANTFGIRGDNDTTGGHRPLDGSITHQWVNIETLPQFIWFQLRDPLLLILKK